MNRRFGPVMVVYLMAVAVALLLTVLLSNRSTENPWWIYLAAVAGPIGPARWWVRLHHARLDREDSGLRHVSSQS